MHDIVRADIEEVRGVAVSTTIMRTLTERGWIRVVGHRDVPGRPAVFATTRSFLDDFGLKTLNELPPMHELIGENDHTPLDDDSKTVQDAPPKTAASADPHAETALTQPLSFADLEARLVARGQFQPSSESPAQNEKRSDDHESESHQ